jgi:hypothetical protein
MSFKVMPEGTLTFFLFKRANFPTGVECPKFS